MHNCNYMPVPLPGMEGTLAFGGVQLKPGPKPMRPYTGPVAPPLPDPEPKPEVVSLPGIGYVIRIEQDGQPPREQGTYDTERQADATAADIYHQMEAEGWAATDWRDLGDGRSLQVMERRGQRILIRLEAQHHAA